MIQLCFSLMTRVSLPQTACSSALLSLCRKDFLIPTQNASSSGQVCGCLSHLQGTWRSQLGSLQAEDDWGLECLRKVFFICFLCFLTSPDIHFGAVRGMILGGKLLVWCSIDIFRRQNPVYCVLLHNSLFCPRGVLLMLLCLRLHNSNFFNFPSQDRTSDLSFHPLNSPLSAPHLPGATLLTAGHRAAAESLAALGTTEGLILTSCRLSCLSTPTGCLPFFAVGQHNWLMLYSDSPWTLLCRAVIQTLVLHPISVQLVTPT